jgi:8-oxo-dGTP pyrophosphatase MutT (NUDIX family)
MIDNRQWLHEKLGIYGDRYRNNAAEVLEVNKIRSFIEQNDNCFERSNLYGHITGSAWITNETFDSFLLMHHRKLGLWLQPGGHADGESNILKVALQEAREESGIQDFKIISDDIFDVDIHTFPARGKEPEHFHFDIRFLFQTSSATPLPSPENEESLALAWVSLEDIFQNPLYENVRQMAEKSKELPALLSR